MTKIKIELLLIILCLCLVSCKNTASSDLNSTVSDMGAVVNNSSYISSEPTTSSQTEDQYTSTVETSSSVVVCNHSYSITSVTADCTNNGHTIYTCSKCKATYKETASASGHDFKYTETAATCTVEGSRTGVCRKCGVKTSEKTSPPTGHSFSGASCSNCGLKDIDKARNMLFAWFKDHSSFDERTYGQTYSLPSDNKYYLWANEYKNCSFTLSQSNVYIYVSVYGFEKNKCYVKFKQDGYALEGEFPMDSLHSSDRNFFNAMNCTASGDKKQQLISNLRSQIDGFLLKFENEVLKPQVNITLNDLGFTLY